MSRLLVSAAAVALLTSAALAADIPYEAPVEVAPVPVGWDWSGFYAGGFAGYGWADVDVDDVDGYNAGFPPEDFSYETDGVYFGTLFGYNWQYNNFVFGLEGEVGRLEAEDDAQAPGRAGIDGDSIASVDVDTFGNGSARLGLAWNNWLVYAKGGVAFADVEVEYEDSNPDGGNTLIGETENDDWLFGYTVGGGVEVGFWDGWAVRGEYLYTDLEDISNTATDSTFGGSFEFNHELEDIHTVKLGITHKF